MRESVVRAAVVLGAVAVLALGCGTAEPAAPAPPPASVVKAPDPDRSAVPADRRGISESIEARLARAGGSATITSTPGEGTEVELRLEHKP